MKKQDDKKNNITDINEVASNLKIQIDNTPPDPFTIIPNHILRTITDTDTLAVACYLASHDQSWIPHPTQIQKHFGFKDHVWRKVSANLRLGGYLTLSKGGQGGGGSHLKFTTWLKKSPDFRDVDFPTLGKSDPRKINALKNKQKQIRNNNIKSNNKQERDVVVDLECEIIKKLTIFGINKLTSSKWVKCYGPCDVNEKIRILEATLKQGKEIKSKASWMCAALRDNYKMPENKEPKKMYASPEESLKERRMIEEGPKASEATVRHGLQSIKEILSKTIKEQK